MLGKAAVAMWWDVAPEMKAEWEDWHSHEHMPERLAIPGFLRGTRWIALSGEPSYFVLYEAAKLATITERRVPRAPEQSDAVVAQDDAAPPQHGAQPVPRARELRAAALARTIRLRARVPHREVLAAAMRWSALPQRKGLDRRAPARVAADDRRDADHRAEDPRRRTLGPTGCCWSAATMSTRCRRHRARAGPDAARRGACALSVAYSLTPRDLA